MKIRLTEKQLKYLINESERSNKAKELADNLLNNPNNEPIWKVIHSDNTKSIFTNGYTSEYRGQGEGSYHGEGTYVFVKPQGAAKRCGTGGVGDLITKGVLVGGFKGFIILISELAEKYYGTSDLRYQLKLFYGEDMVDEIYQECVKVARENNCAIMSSFKNGRFNGPISAAVLSTNAGGRRFKPAKYRDLTLKSNVRGIVYNGGNDPYAAVIFDARSVIPLAITHNRELNKRTGDFDNWEYLVSDEMLDSYKKFKDYFPDAQRLLTQGKIKDYLEQPPRYGLMRVTLKNGKTSFFDTENKIMVSEVGFDEIYMPEEDDGFITITVAINTKKGKRNLYIVKNDNEYILCKRDGFNFTPIMRMSQYDKQYMSKNNLTESIVVEHTPEEKDSKKDFKNITGFDGDAEVIYHRTNDLKSTEGIGEYGFSYEYTGKNGEYFGHGLYTTPYLDVCNNVLRDFGSYMIRSYLKHGFEDFLILEPSLARKYYGNNCSPKEQMKMLMRPNQYDYMVQTYGREILEPSPRILKVIAQDLGRTYIRGIVVPYHSERNGYISVVRNYNDCIPYSYSTDNGKTWNKILTKEKYEWINRAPDGLYSILPYINHGIVKDIYGNGNGGYDWKRVVSKLQFRNGHLRVQLTNGKISFYSAEKQDLISYRGFDDAINFDFDSNGRLKLDCLINFEGEEYPFRVYITKKGNYCLCAKNSQTGRYEMILTMKDYDGE